ncbi:MAG: hypothetical protein HY078_02465 [Elusimicrobia bacterium]|nr:hypothetical protein [Elusimicrobiota bacterium]
MRPIGDSSFLLRRLLLALGSLVLLWPGDVPWVNDEPILLSFALECKRAGVVAAHGLTGSRGVTYGPAPVWFYTALLWLTQDLTTLVLIRAVLAALALGAGLVLLANACGRLRPTLGALAFLSPYLWLYNRMLWDNITPYLSILVLAAYASFCADKKAWKAWVVSMGLVLMLLSHVKTAAFAAPIALIAVVFHRQWLASHWRTCAAQAAVAAALAAPYARYLATHPAHAPSAGTGGSAWAGALFPLLGAQWFSSQGLEYFLGPDWPGGFGAAVRLAAAATGLAFPLFWLGIVLAARSTLEGLRDAGTRDADFHVGAACLAVLAGQCALHAYARAYGQPHYFDAVWACAFYLLWRACSWLWTNHARFGIALTSVYGAALACVLGTVAVGLHRSAGNRELHYGPALSQQIAVARAVAAHHPESPVYLKVRSMQLFPNALSAIMDLHGLKRAASAPRRVVTVRYAHPEGADGHLAVDAAPVDEAGR